MKFQRRDVRYWQICLPSLRRLISHVALRYFWNQMPKLGRVRVGMEIEENKRRRYRLASSSMSNELNQAEFQPPLRPMQLC